MDHLLLDTGFALLKDDGGYLVLNRQVVSVPDGFVLGESKVVEYWINYTNIMDTELVTFRRRRLRSA